MKRREFIRRLPGILFALGIRHELGAASSQSVLLNRFSIAGFRYYDGPRLLPYLKVGATLRLEAQPHHPEDEFAVAIFWKRFQLGYVPRSDNRHISRLLQQGIPLQCSIEAVNPDAVPWQQVKVQVRMGR